MKAKIIEKIKILLSNSGLRELLRLEPCTGDQVDSSPGALNGDQLDLALGSIMFLGDFDLKMYIMEKLFDIIRGLKTILSRSLNVKGFRNSGKF